MSTAVRIEGVSKTFHANDGKQVHALRDVGFDIEEGEFFGLLGPNGAGKSTLINIMAGLTRADTGFVHIKGHDVVTGYRQSRMALGVVPQELIYDPFFTVGELLGLQSGYFGLGRGNRAWIEELLAILELTDKTHSNMHSLSGGMKRRVLIAQALVHKPPVVVLDEPTAGVDVELRRALWGFTRSLHEQGHTIVLTTHYLEEAEELCGRIAILQQGALAALDTTEALLSRHPYRFLNVKLEGTAEVVVPEPLLGVVDYQHNGELCLKLDKRKDSISGVLDALRQGGIEFEDLAIREPSLEEVFLDMTGDHGEAGQ